MKYLFENETIFLTEGIDKEKHSNEFSFHITRASSVITPAQLRIPKHQQTILCLAGWICMVVGSFYRYIVYRHLFNEYKKKKLSPINILIIFSIVISHLGILISVIYDTLVVYYGENLRIITGYEFCFVVRFMFGFEMFYSFVSTLGIALYRILLIKQNNWVKYGIGEENLLHIILLIGLISTLGVGIALLTADSLDIVGKKCIIIPGSDLLEIIGQYQQSLGYFPFYLNVNRLRRYIVLTLVFMALAELSIYICFFRHVHKNDNSESLLRALGSKVIKARNKTNALTFFSQFCSFIFQLAFILLMLFASLNLPSKSHAYVLATFLRKMSFAVMAIIEVKTSRKNLKAT